MKATTFLLLQHRRVEELVTALEGERYVRATLLENLAEDLSVTLTMKERIFYPAVRDVLDDAKLREVEGVRRALQRCFEVSDEVEFQSALRALGESVRAHFRDDEHALLPSAEKIHRADELERLGVQMTQLQREILDADGDARVSPIGRPSRADWYLFAEASR